MPESGCGIPELTEFQHFLRDQCKIVVYDYSSKSVIFEGVSDKPRINLLYHNNHYNVITSLTSTFCCTYFCESCHVGFGSRNKHRCSGSCPCCLQSPPCAKVTSEILCTECKRSFRGQECFDNHKVDGVISSNHGICSNIKKCEKCRKTYIINKKKRLVHQCDESYCKNCDKYVVGDHLCHIKPNENCPPSLEKTMFVFYDLETRQEKQFDNAQLHEPNLCVYKQCCGNCINSTNNNCDKCGVRLRVVMSNTSVKIFVSNLISLSKVYKKVVVLAHNGKAFDHQFILKYILEETNLTPKLIMRGTQIILMEVDNIKFIDSLNYFPMPLAALPKAFDLKTTLTKGYFPHLFNTLENSDYVGPFPNIEYYTPDSMKAEEREKFLVWYGENKNKTFNMKQEIIKYCINDVEILSEACIKFRSLL